eukprot:803938-Rhodomonas_salina.1
MPPAALPSAPLQPLPHLPRPRSPRLSPVTCSQKVTGVAAGRVLGCCGCLMFIALQCDEQRKGLPRSPLRCSVPQAHRARPECGCPLLLEEPPSGYAAAVRTWGRCKKRVQMQRSTAFTLIENLQRADKTHMLTHTRILLR